MPSRNGKAPRKRLAHKLEFASVPEGSAKHIKVDPFATSGGLHDVPPPSIQFATGDASEVDALVWEEDKTARDQSSRIITPTAQCYRLLGSTSTITFRLTDMRQGVWSSLCKPVAWSQRMWNGVKGKMEFFNQTGEPGTRGVPVLTVERLRSAVDDGILILENNQDVLLLTALEAYVKPAELWKLPLMRVLVRHTRCPDGVTVNVTLDVYAARLLFCVIADSTLQIIMDRIVAPTAHVFPLQVDPPSENVYLRSSSLDIESDTRSFTSDALLRATESTGYPTRGTKPPTELALEMRPHQLRTYAWMRDQETLESGINGKFFECRSFADGGTFWYSPILGELRIGTDVPPIVRGGVVADEMGMGKTLCAAALIAANPKNDECEGGTLIVVPSTLLEQWMTELEKSWTPNTWESLSPLVFPTGELPSEIWLRRLKGAGVVLVSYKMLEKCARMFHSLRWTRVILDEMQEVRSRNTKVASACRQLEADFRFMISGTPLYTGIDDLHGELNFLNVYPWARDDRIDGFWKLRVKDPFTAGNVESWDLVCTLMRTLFIRHSKAQTVRATGRNILELPPLTEHVKRVPLTTIERALVCYVESLGVEARKRHPDASTSKADGGTGQIPMWVGQVWTLAQLTSWSPCLLARDESQKKLDMFVRNMLSRGAMRVDTSRVVVTDVDWNREDRAEAKRMAAQTEHRGSHGIHIVTAQVAIETLQRALEVKAKEDFVSDQNAQNVWGATRAVHINTEEDKMELQELEARITGLHKTVQRTADIPRLRWRWAILSVVRATFGSTEDTALTPQRDLRDHVRRVAPTIATRWARRIELKKKEDTIREAKRVAAVEEKNASALDAEFYRGNKAAGDKKKRAQYRKKYIQALHKYDGDLSVVGFTEADKLVKSAANLVRHVEVRRVLYTQFLSENTVKAHDAAVAALNVKVTIPGALISRIVTADIASQYALTPASTQSWDQHASAKLPLSYQVMGNNSVRGTYHIVYRLVSETVHACYKNTAGKFMFFNGEMWFLASCCPFAAQSASSVDDTVMDTDAGEAGPARPSDTGSSRDPLDSFPGVLMYGKAHVPSDLDTWLVPMQSTSGRQQTVTLNVTVSPGDVTLAGSLDVLAYEPSTIQTEATKAHFELNKQCAYADLLRKRIGATEEKRERIVQTSQTRFEVLGQMAAGAAPPSCPICFDDVQERPVVTRCVHMFCHDCILKHVGAKGSKCPFCRQNIVLDELLEIHTRHDSAAGAAGEAGEASSAPDEPGSMMDVEDAHETDHAPPSYSHAATTKEFEAMLKRDVIGTYGNQKYFAISPHGRTWLHELMKPLPREDPSFIRHTYGSKVATVIEDIRSILSDDPTAKVVVATTMRPTLDLVVKALTHAGIRTVKLDSANITAEQEQALAEFKSAEPGMPPVLILHAGHAAAGLTLTCARHMLLLEPFFKRGEELQTMNRCHRIGQDKPVEVTTYYTAGTLEERLLAYRERELEEDTDDLGSALRSANADDSRGLSSDKAQFVLGLEPRDSADQSTAKSKDKGKGKGKGKGKQRAR
eukprot:m.174656 g.174656  ORF g.174656 m.174656 type:complete len:1539 (-) comp13862_c0_seq1:285-4901(-)